MPVSQPNITTDMPLGANLAPGGVTFRTWAPTARQVYIALKQPTGKFFSEE
jgi:1,4-alpha-glucan branching enzyme